MRIIIMSALIINLLAIVMLLVGLLYNFKNPKNKAVYGYTLAGSMILYMVTFGLISIYGLLIIRNLWYIIPLLCVLSPFAIGKLVKYETLKKYTVVQIMCFALSLAIGLLV